MCGYDIAKSMLQTPNLHEVRDNKEIRAFFRKYSKAGDMDIDPANIPWCAAFVNCTERAAGNKGTGRLDARSFLNYGTTIPVKQIKQGDIVVFKRGGSTWQGHVAYFDGWDKDKQGNTLIRTIGGNQSDSISYGWYPLTRLIGARRA